MSDYAAKDAPGTDDALIEAVKKIEYPDGTVVGIDFCECETWTVGEPRCECGNRRIYLTGEVINGKAYVYPMGD